MGANLQRCKDRRYAMQKSRLHTLAGLFLMAMIAALQLSGCTSPADTQMQAEHEGHGPGYEPK